MSVNSYIDLRKKAIIMRDDGGHDISLGECHPEFFERLTGLVLGVNLASEVIWEPFAGHTRESRNQDFSSSVGLKLVSFDLEPIDDRVQRADSTVEWPHELIGGVFFHPPYFGTRPFSIDRRDLSMIEGWGNYLSLLKKTIVRASSLTVKGGFACAVGRDYRHGGKRIRLDLEFLRMFEENSFDLIGVMESVPDMALVFTKVR